MATQTLLQPFEVVKITPVEGHTNTAQFCNRIALEEETLFNDCLGDTFYQDLLGDLTIVPSFVLFEQGATYLAGDVVEFESYYYECIQATDGSQTPCDADYFTQIPKFQNADYQLIWDKYLKFIIAFSVVNGSINYSSIQFTNQGTVRNESDNGKFRPAEAKEMSMLVGSFQADIRRYLQNLHTFIMKEANQSKYPNYKPLLDNPCGCDDGKCQQGEDDYFGFNLYPTTKNKRWYY